MIKENDFQISFNLSSSDLEDLNHIEQIIKLLETHQISPSRIIFEILENITNRKQAMLAIARLQETGFGLAIDDFGADYSNFSRLLFLKPDYIKIDHQFIKQIHVDSDALKITRAITEFARNSGILTVAEFVHCREVQDKVMELGIDFSQGYFFSEPSELFIP